MDDSERYEDAQNFITCPYNPAHSCPKFRLARHLVKCRKQHVELAKEQRTCPFNSTHVMPLCELPYHESICPDRDQLYLYTHKTEDAQNPVVEELFKNTMKKVEIPSEENWDDEIDPNVNIIERCRRNAVERGVLQSNSNEPPAERKALRMEQRMKTRERMNAEEEKKRLCAMTQHSDDSESVSSYRSGSASASPYSFVAAQNIAENSMRSISKPSSSSSSVGRGRGKSVLKSCSSMEIGYGRGKR